MRVLLEAHHPAHIHFWKHPVRELQVRGHEVLLIGRDRDVMRRLLEVYDWIPSVIPPRKNKKNRFPLVEMLQRQWTVAAWVRRFQPDVVASLMGSYTQTAKLLGVRNIIFTDSEFQHFNHRIAHPFADEIYTPECFYKNLGSKQRCYRGLHELMFLRLSKFEADAQILNHYKDLEPGGYIILRVSSWNTLHDVGHSGIGSALQSFTKKHSRKYKILVSAEEGRQLPIEGVGAIQIAPEHFHELLAFSAFVLTEGASTASEAACLGVPTVYINSTQERGYLRSLESEYRIVRGFQKEGEGIRCAEEWLDRLESYSHAERTQFRSILDSEFPDGSDFVVEQLIQFR